MCYHNLNISTTVMSNTCHGYIHITRFLFAVEETEVGLSSSMQMRNPKEVEKTEYNEFYKKTFNEFLDPLAYTHFTTEVWGAWKFTFSSVYAH